MDKFKKIIPFIFLTLYGLVMAHAVIPHIHFNLDRIETILGQHHEEHAHSHHEHSHYHDYSSQPWLDEFLGWLDDLRHNNMGENHLDEYLSGDRIDLEISSPAIFKSVFTESLIYTNSLSPEKERDDRFDRPLILYESYYNSSDPLRGPPIMS